MTDAHTGRSLLHRLLGAGYGAATRVLLDAIREQADLAAVHQALCVVVLWLFHLTVSVCVSFTAYLSVFGEEFGDADKCGSCATDNAGRVALEEGARNGYNSSPLIVVSLSHFLLLCPYRYVCGRCADEWQSRDVDPSPCPRLRGAPSSPTRHR
jgi:hypothetical protein